jgi:hypothetical protein
MNLGVVTATIFTVRQFKESEVGHTYYAVHHPRRGGRGHRLYHARYQPQHTTHRTAMNKTVITIRWIARILSVLIILFWGYMIAGHLIGTEAQASRPLVASDSAQVAMMLLWLVGLALAWRWELVGAVIALMGALIGALLNPKAAGLGVVPAVPALLFLFCWWRSRVSRHTP